jgi:hypothetical protein
VKGMRQPSDLNSFSKAIVVAQNGEVHKRDASDNVCVPKLFVEVKRKRNISQAATESRKESMRATVESEPPTHEGLTIGVC